MKYRDYTISKSGSNYTINTPSGERLGTEVAATVETAKKWVDMDINEGSAAERRKLLQGVGTGTHQYTEEYLRNRLGDSTYDEIDQDGLIDEEGCAGAKRLFQCEVWVSINDGTFEGPHPESLTCSVAQILHRALVNTSHSGVTIEEIGVVTDQGLKDG